ncbi:hypothetical protein N7532_008091 [Penicillium argentinense]|uniref:Mediator of RNA polymerase II transcription subunit 19 n=1 Tax=Penicillium argentinense TaxID=1131581 RepID=A0A9W9EWS1_9EURO|nr:uncharacterized protein N7532_008091 [Penicillium argentinense]KAJ5089407.1 hypothetical protein N7532_008091 [Penicillium argentinense]
MSERDPSTTFPAGPPSPSSPAAGFLKDNRQLPVSSDHIPQTPTSPPLMSVSDSSHVSNFAPAQTSPTQVTTQPPNTSSPPSSAPMSTQVSQQPIVSMTNSFPTPASSVSGQLANTTSAEDADQRSFGSTTQDSTKTMDVSGHQKPEDKRTDHERQQSVSTTAAGGRDLATDQTDGDAMDVDKEPLPQAETRNLGLDSLQNDFSSAFHLCKNAPTVTGPNPAMDLISLYGLGPIAQSVARMDPNTGEKINRLRKSYEGKLKGLGLAGRNKPVKQEPGAPGSLRHLTLWPEEEWQNQKVVGKQIQVADIDSALHGLQNRAMQLEPGMVPNNDFWEDVLGHEKPAKNQGSGDTGKKSASAAPSPAPRSILRTTTPAAVTQESERPRASRGRKRHYDDNSFVGYGEGYADDDDDTGFYSNGEGTGKKKRKKDHVSKVSTPLSERGGSYGVGMFGIGAR